MALHRVSRVSTIASRKFGFEGIRAGNLYVNRPTTGAIVLRQPFGGMGKSAFGPGIKAGGPNYVVQLMNFKPTGNPTRDGKINNESRARFAERLKKIGETEPHNDPAERPSLVEIEKLLLAIDSYDFAAFHEFNRRHDHFELIGQDNVRRYLPVQQLCIRVHSSDSWFEILGRVIAAHCAGCRILVSFPPDEFSAKIEFINQLTEAWAGDIELIEQTDSELAEAIRENEINRIRYAHPNRVPFEIRKAVIGKYIHIADQPVLDEGRIELLWYVEEQSVSDNYHRYGNLGSRSNEKRRETI